MKKKLKNTGIENGGLLTEPMVDPIIQELIPTPITIETKSMGPSTDNPDSNSEDL